MAWRAIQAALPREAIISLREKITNVAQLVWQIPSARIHLCDIWCAVELSQEKNERF